MKILKLWLLATLSLFYSISMFSMDTPEYKATDNKVYVLTADEQLIKVPLWQIKEMKVLLIILEHQKGDNNQQNPIKATMLNSQELTNLIKALHSIAEGKFNEFYEELAISDNALLEKNHGKQILSLENGSIRKLINAAERIQASGLSAFCLSKNLPMDLQKEEIIPLFIDPCMDLLIAQKILKEPQYITAIDFSPDGNKIIVGAEEATNLVLLDINNPNAIKSGRLKGHKGSVKVVAFSSDGKKIISGSEGSENNLILWDINNYPMIRRYILKGHSDSVNTVAFSTDGKKIVSGSNDNGSSLIIWDISNPQATTSQVLERDHTILTVAMSFDGTKMISAYAGEDTLVLWDISNSKNIRHQLLDENESDFSAVVFSPDGTKIASSSSKSIVNLWDISNPQNITYQALSGHSGGVFAIKFSPDGRKIVSGAYTYDNQNNLILWDISNPEKITHQALQGHSGLVEMVAFSADGNKIASASSNTKNNLFIWDISNPKAIRHKFLEGNKKEIVAMAFSADGNKIAAASFSKPVLLYYLITPEEKKLLYDCNIVQAQLMYQLCLASQSGNHVQINSPYTKKVYNSLPLKIKQLLQRALGISIA